MVMQTMRVPMTIDGQPGPPVMLSAEKCGVCPAEHPANLRVVQTTGEGENIYHIVCDQCGRKGSAGLSLIDALRSWSILNNRPIPTPKEE